VDVPAAALTRDCLSPEECLGYVQGKQDAAADRPVQTHIDGCTRCRVVIAEAARALLTLGLEVSEPASPAARSMRTLTVGDQLSGRYDVRRFVARGGMGEVYEAFDRVLGEPVALKTLSLATLDRADAAERFMAEVRLARKVTHPNVCRILELGVHAKGGTASETIPFFTMELLVGETLAARLARVGRLDPVAALRILEGVAAGLAAVHDAGIVHRDFKSDNVFLVRRTDGTERAVVMDFGLARTTRSVSAAGSSSPALVGTADYMAPEQVEGRNATRASDIYALGIVAFEMVTGQRPFSGDTPMASAVARLYREAPRPSQLRPELDAIWDRVISRCLARDPALRFAHIEDPVAALEPASSQRRGHPARWSRRALGASVAIAIALAGGVGMLGAAARQSVRSSPSRPSANGSNAVTAPARAGALPPPAMASRQPAAAATMAPPATTATASPTATLGARSSEGVTAPLARRRVRREIDPSGASRRPQTSPPGGAATPPVQASPREPGYDDVVNPFAPLP